MNDFVAKQNAICPVCGKTHMVGVLLHRELKSIEDQTTHYEMCEEHQKLHDDGYIALVEVTNENSDVMKIHEADRTGRIAHVRYEAMEEITGTDYSEFSMLLVDSQTIDLLENM